MPDVRLPLIYRVHAVRRMAERDIREEDVAHVVFSGKIIEDYPQDTPYPSSLMLGWRKGRPIHVVSAATEHEIIIITVYEPDPAQWQPGFEKRKP
ncbi:MAG: DUF4258 domain-containing protein [Candidatus Acidiferrales bacterium]